jgi:hypothetical protein
MDEMYAVLAQIHRLSPVGTPKPLAEPTPRSKTTLAQAVVAHWFDSQPWRDKRLEKTEDVTFDNFEIKYGEYLR